MNTINKPLKISKAVAHKLLRRGYAEYNTKTHGKVYFYDENHFRHQSKRDPNWARIQSRALKTIGENPVKLVSYVDYAPVVGITARSTAEAAIHYQIDQLWENIRYIAYTTWDLDATPEEIIERMPVRSVILENAKRKLDQLYRNADLKGLMRDR